MIHLVLLIMIIQILIRSLTKGNIILIYNHFFYNNSVKIIIAIIGLTLQILSIDTGRQFDVEARGMVNRQFDEIERKCKHIRFLISETFHYFGPQKLRHEELNILSILVFILNIL